VKVLEERTPFATALDESEQLAIERVCELTRTPTGVNGIRRSIENRTMLAYEMLPGAVMSAGAGAGERQIFEMQGS
jgi:hypothetical protein